METKTQKSYVHETISTKTIILEVKTDIYKGMVKMEKEYVGDFSFDILHKNGKLLERRSFSKGFTLEEATKRMKEQFPKKEIQRTFPFSIKVYIENKCTDREFTHWENLENLWWKYKEIVMKDTDFKSAYHLLNEL